MLLNQNLGQAALMKITENRKAELNRISIAVRDFEQAIKYASKAIDYSIDTIEYEALLFAAIVCYCKPFSQNERDKSSPANSSLELTNFSDLSIPENLLHKSCKEVRNRMLAHSEFQFNPTGFNEAYGVFSGRQFSLNAYPLDVSAFIALNRPGIAGGSNS